VAPGGDPLADVAEPCEPGVTFGEFVHEAADHVVYLVHAITAEYDRELDVAEVVRAQRPVDRQADVAPVRISACHRAATPHRDSGGEAENDDHQSDP
jgi:hypothetical protein